MNASSSGVALEAAKTRSPSFSRSSSSTTSTALPARMSARARSIESNSNRVSAGGVPVCSAVIRHLPVRQLSGRLPA